MTHYCILRAAKITTYGNLSASGQHTWRERETHNADPTLTALNTNHAPATCAAELVAAVRERVDRAEHKAERPVLAIEYLVTASPEALDKMSEDGRERYFLDALKWFEKKHGKENIVAANIQRDETTQHMVVYAVPLVETAERTRKRSVIVGTNPDGTKRRETREFTEKAGSKLSAAEFLDGPAKLSRMQTNFAKEVGANHGLERGLIGSKAHHKEVREYYARVRAEFEPLPEVTTPQAKKLRPEPEPPGFFAGRATKDKYEKDLARWEREYEAAERQNKQRRSEIHAQNRAAVETAKRHQAQAAEAAALKAAVAEARKTSAFHIKKGVRLDQRCKELEAKLALFTPGELEHAEKRKQENERARSMTFRERLNELMPRKEPSQELRQEREPKPQSQRPRQSPDNSFDIS